MYKEPGPHTGQDHKSLESGNGKGQAFTFALIWNLKSYSDFKEESHQILKRQIDVICYQDPLVMMSFSINITSLSF